MNLDHEKEAPPAPFILSIEPPLRPQLAGWDNLRYFVVLKNMEIDTIKCPCCEEERDVIQDTPLLAVEAALSQHNASPWWAQSKGEGWSVSKAESGDLQWACNSCLASGRGIAAQPWGQRFCDYCPHFAYFDISLRCNACHNPFVFSDKEQQHWYEVLNFWVQSRPNHCRPCRRIRREQATAERNRQQEQNAHK